MGRPWERQLEPLSVVRGSFLKGAGVRHLGERERRREKEKEQKKQKTDPKICPVKLVRTSARRSKPPSMQQ